MNQELAIDDVEAIIADLETEYTKLTEFAPAYEPTTTSEECSLPPGCPRPF